MAKDAARLYAGAVVFGVEVDDEGQTMVFLGTVKALTRNQVRFPIAIEFRNVYWFESDGRMAGGPEDFLYRQTSRPFHTSLADACAAAKG